MTIGTLLVWSATSSNDILTRGETTAYLHKHLVNILIGLVLAAAVMATDHRWVRIMTPLVYVASVIGLMLVLVMGTTINGSRSWLMLGGLSIQPAEFAKLAVVDRDGDDHRRARRELPPASGGPGRRRH